MVHAMALDPCIMWYDSDCQLCLQNKDMLIFLMSDLTFFHDIVLTLLCGNQ